MITTEKQGFYHLLKISLPYLLFSIAYTVLFLFLEEQLGDRIYKVSGQIGSVFGLAVAFFLGFRMNSAYDRWWEARKIFGELTNNTRSFVTKIFVYFKNKKNLVNGNTEELLRDMIDLSRSYIRQLKNEMHNKFHPTVDEKTKVLFKKYNIEPDNKRTNEILLALTSIIEQNFLAGSNIEKSDLMQHINRFYDIQGKAERIKNTSFLKIYAVFTRITVFFYVILLPLFIGDIDIGGEESTLELLSIPIIVAISTVFLTINQLAALFGEPFSEKKTSVPIDEICKIIDTNCLEVLKKI